MAKGGGKSSATSATRKKHAKKAGEPSQEGPVSAIPKGQKLTKKERAQKKKEPRVKVYIPPVKPAPIQPDPLETTGLVHSLPPELLIVLRSFNKKAQVTKIRALEELQSAWIDKCRKEGEDGALVYVLIDMLPVWLHHVPALFVHPSRRIRLLAAGVHLSFVQISPIRDQILSFLRDSASSSQIESILGTWCLAAHDIDKAVASTALKSWADVITFSSSPRDQLLLDDQYLPPLIMFIQRTILDPNGVHLYLNPPAPAAPPPATKKGVRKEDPEPSRSKAEELEESETDRKGRLRIGGLGAIRRIVDTLHVTLPNDLVNFFNNPALWSSLYHAEQCPFVGVESFGYGQHNVRKSAWGLILSLLSAPKEQLESLLPILSVATLRSAWVDPDPTVHAVMWQPLLKFLKAFPSAWEIERSYDYSKDENDDDDDSETSDAEDEKPSTSITPSKTSAAYLEFLHFLELGCSGSPLQGYPTVVIAVSTIPSSILASSPTVTPLDDLLTSFWKVLDSRALSSLQRSATSAAFLSSLFECIVFLIKRVQSDSQSEQSPALLGSGDVNTLIETLVREQVGKAWAHLADGSLMVEQRAVARLVSQMLLSLKEVETGLFAAAWDVLSARLRDATESNAALVSVFLKVLHDKFKHVPESKEAVATLISNTLHQALHQCSDAFAAPATSSSIPHGVRFIGEMLDQFREGFFDDSLVAQSMDDMTAQHAFLMLQSSPSLLLAYLTHRKHEACCLRVWHALLSSVAQDPEKAELSIKPLLDATRRGVLPQYLKPSANETDNLLEILLAQALSGDAMQLAFMEQVLQSPDYFLSTKAYTASMEIILSCFSRQLDSALSDPDVPLSTFEASLRLITTISRHPPRFLPKFESGGILSDIFVFAYLLPACYESSRGHTTFADSKALWGELYKTLPAESQAEVKQRINTKLGVILSETSLRPYPGDVVDMVAKKPPEITFNLLQDVFPSPHEMDKILDTLSPDPIHPSLAVVQPHLPPATAFVGLPSIPSTFDSRGFSTYARIIDALLQVFIEDRKIAKHNLWAIRHFQALELYAQDFISLPSERSDVFAPEAIHASLEIMVSRVQQITTYILTSSADEGWREAALTAAMDHRPLTSSGTLAELLVDTIQRSRTSDNPRDSRILRNILQHVFHDVEAPEADKWMQLARKIEDTAPETSMAIVWAVTTFAPEPPRLDRYRNELAASLLGIPPPKANVEGLLTLRKLCSSAPNPESDVVFLSQPRAVNIMKACQQWITSDEDIDEDVVSVITAIFYHLAPILQGVSGAHWDLIFDILESNLESSLVDDAALVTLARTLRLISLIEDLCSTNKSLRAEWEVKKVSILTIVRDLATASFEHLQPSIPRSTCRGLLLSIVKNLPPSLIDQTTFSKMCHLVTDSSVEVQKMAYQFLAIAAKKYTELLVIEAGVDTEGNVDMTISGGLLNMLQRSTANEDANMESSNVFGYLLSWMLLFDLFHESSLKVRSSYIEQLRNLDVIAVHFIPTLLTLLRLDRGPQKVFKLDPWAVDEFYVEYYEAGSEFGLPVLAAHLYYRALLTVPSLIHTWVTDCKDRQLSSSITNYTSQSFSPVIIRTELAHVKSPESSSLLVDENFTIKVASSVNEVVASYSVDEHQLEIKLKIPADWPLHKIEIKDLKRVGVDENRWRAWILAVQQIIWSHNGRIIDGLGLFKKNVTLHFEGQVECAICYSIISVMDGTLPRKPCRTCKNRFHAGCLYKALNHPTGASRDLMTLATPHAHGRISDLVALITSAAKTIESHYSQSSPPIVPSLNDQTPHPLDSAISPPELKEAVQILEGACAQLSATVAQPSHTVLNRALQICESTSLNVVTTYNIADILQETTSGMHIEEIARKAGIDHGRLGRILRLLASKHIFQEVDLDCFANNRLSLELLSSSPLATMVGWITDEERQKANSTLTSYLADPEWGSSEAPEHSPWNKSSGCQVPMFKYFEGATPEAAKQGARFGLAMQGWNAATQAGVTIAKDYPWEALSAGATVCDVGGGIGNIAMELLRVHPNLQLKLQDLPNRIHQAETQVWPSKYPEAIAEKRIEFKGMDFLVDSPIPECDVYYVKNIIHNWPDKECIQILRGIRAVLKPSGRVLLHDYVLQHATRSKDPTQSAFKEAPEPLLPNYGQGAIRQYNLDVGLMMVMLNSKERTLEEFIEMAKQADLEFIKLWPAGEMAIAEFKAL